MRTRPLTTNPSRIMVEQLVAMGVKYVFYNPGSREALFFDALQAHPHIDGILALHEGSVTAMAGGYTQVNCDPAVMTVHLGAGLAQSMGQLINVWSGNLPVVVITFAGDTGSFADKIELDLSHDVGPTSIAAPLTKANWTVIEPEGLPEAIERAIRVATTPPVGPVHLAVYDRVLGDADVNARIIEGKIPHIRGGCPSDTDLEQLAEALHHAKRPLIYVGDGVWKSGAEAQAAALAEYFGAAIATSVADLRAVPIKHPQHCGRIEAAAEAVDPDTVVCIGIRHSGSGTAADYAPFAKAERIIALGSDVANLENFPGLDLAMLADEKRALERLGELMLSESASESYRDRREAARETAARLRERRRRALPPNGDPSCVGPLALLDTLDRALERIGGGLLTTEQFAVPLDCALPEEDGGKTVFIRPAGGSEGYGIGAPIGLKLAAPEKPVVSLVGDGSLYYADSGLWTAAHHSIPVLYVISNNRGYGIVAGAFGGAQGHMKGTGEYEGVVLEGMDPVKIAEAFGVEGIHVETEPELENAIANGLDVTEKEGRPYLLDVRLPLGLPQGGRARNPFRLSKSGAR